MSITISSCFPGHWVRTYTTTTTVNVINGLGLANSNTNSSDSFERGPNQYGQAGNKIVFYNESDKDIKYIHFKVVALNSVGDVVGLPITLKATGPIKKHSVQSSVWDYIWNNSSICQTGIFEATIEYFDGTIEKQSLTPKENEKELYVDGSVGHTLTTPILLTLALCACLVGENFLSHYSLSHYHYKMRLGMPNLFSTTNDLMLIIALLGIATIIFSKRLRNKKGTIAGCGMMLVIGTISSIMQLLNNSSTHSYAYHFPALMTAFQAGTIVLLVLLLLSALNSIHYSHRQRVLKLALILLCILAGTLGALVANDLIYSTTDTELIYFGIELAAQMFFWGLIVAVANRCRIIYPTT